MGKFVVVVEDCHEDQMMVTRALSQMEATPDVRHISDGREALEYFTRGQGRRPDLIILDIKLPYVNGLSILERIRSEKRYRFVPIVMTSTSTMPRDVQSAYKMGANSFLEKAPLFEWAKALRITIEYWLNLNYVEHDVIDTSPNAFV